MESCRQRVGLPVTIGDTPTELHGVVETWLIDATTHSLAGILVGSIGKKTQAFLPLECLEFHHDFIQANCQPIKPDQSFQRVLGLVAWSSEPRFFVGFVHDCLFHPTTGQIGTFVIYQLFRTWQIPGLAVIAISPKGIVIDTDTTLKLKLTPFPQP